MTERSITCPRCGMTSHSEGDIAQGYCGNCHDWTAGNVSFVNPDDTAERLALLRRRPGAQARVAKIRRDMAAMRDLDD